jgi:23S rRNA (cytosine1962-C5)-methyltransferase
MTTNSKDDYQAELFSNRLSKKYKILRKWSRHTRVTCFRLYDRDIPEIPLAVDLYELLPPDVSGKLDAARFLVTENARISANDVSVETEIRERRFIIIYLYERPYEKPENEEKAWLEKMAEKTAIDFNIPGSHIIIKTRKHDKGGSQYEKPENAAPPLTGIVQEQGQLFHINLNGYLDTGLFFDHRPLRAHIRDISSGKSIANLYSYTGSFSVYAAEGHAARIESVDLSNTYLDWARNNMVLNEFTDKEKYIFTRSDVTGFLNQKNAEVPDAAGTNRYDIIILDPPTFSNSKTSERILDINRDWPDLVTKCLNILTPGGTLYFSTNSRRLVFDKKLLPLMTSDKKEISTFDITAKTIPEDYRNTKIHRCWECVKSR